MATIKAASRASSDVIPFGIQDTDLSPNARTELQRRARIETVRAELAEKKRISDLVATANTPQDAAEKMVDHEMGLIPCLDTACEEHHPPAKLHFYTPAEIATTTPAEPEWIVEGYIAKEAITELDGKVKVSGKTTLSLDAVRSVLSGEDFAGKQTTRTNVVFLTEQQRGPFLHALKRARLDHYTDNLYILFRRDMAGLTWPQVVEQAVAKCHEAGAALLVVDTMAKLAGVKEENAAEGWMSAMEPLQNAAHDGLAILINRHSRKSAGDVGDTGRGSSAASGDVDIILELKRPEGNQTGTTRRILEALSRYDQTPEKIVIELTDEGYQYIGDEAAVSIADAKRGILEALRSASPDGMKKDAIIERSGMSGASFDRGAKDLISSRTIISTVLRGKGSPLMYEIPTEHVSPRILSFSPVRDVVGGREKNQPRQARKPKARGHAREAVIAPVG